MDPIDEDPTPLKVVELDAVAMIRIMKHCRQHMPHAVTGQLLGLDVGDTMQVTGCFPYTKKPTYEEQPRFEQRADQETADKDEKYQLEMLRALREVNLDANTVGWYQSAYLGTFLSDTFVETQYLYQESINRSVVIVFDPLQTNTGRPQFKAYQLSDEFMQRQKEAKMNNSPFGPSLHRLPAEKMFIEIPIIMRSSMLTEAFVADWVLPDPRAMSTQFDALDLENQLFLEKNVQFLLGCLEDLAQEQVKLQQYERMASRGMVPRRNDRFNKGNVQPRQLDTVLIARQIQTYCKQINGYAGDSFGKLFLMANKPEGAN